MKYIGCQLSAKEKDEVCRMVDVVVAEVRRASALVVRRTREGLEPTGIGLSPLEHDIACRPASGAA